MKIEWSSDALLYPELDDFCLIKGVKYFENRIREVSSSLDRAWNVRLEELIKNHTSWVEAIKLAFGSVAIITWPNYYTCLITFDVKFLTIRSEYEKKISDRIR